MAKTVKFTDEELQEIKELQNLFQQSTYQAGRYYFEKSAFDRKKELIDSYFENAKQQETALIQKINEKYGAGSINLETGEFTPTSTPEDQVEEKTTAAT